MPADRPANNANRAPSLAWACIRLALIVAAAYPIVAMVGSRMAGAPVWEMTAVAAGVCWLSSTLALVLFHVFQQAGNVVAGTLLGTLVRLGIPLLAVFVVLRRGGTTADAGLILVFYLVTLAADTMLSLGLARATMATKGKEGRLHG